VGRAVKERQVPRRWPRCRDSGHRIEFFTGLLPARDDVVSPLAALALYSAREGVALDHGQTVPAVGALWPGTELRWFLVLRPVGDKLADLVATGAVEVPIAATYPLDRIADAFAQLEQRQTRGKIVLIP
jgi:NADPH:quinone reductase-like Zn-dependent oxidoreductase